jgi:hypothetical protein
LCHTYASALAQSGVLTISKLLGHADTHIASRHYAHLCDNTLKAAVARLPSFGHSIEGEQNCPDNLSGISARTDLDGVD